MAWWRQHHGLLHVFHEQGVVHRREGRIEEAQDVFLLLKPTLNQQGSNQMGQPSVLHQMRDGIRFGCSLTIQELLDNWREWSFSEVARMDLIQSVAFKRVQLILHCLKYGKHLCQCCAKFHSR